MEGQRFVELHLPVSAQQHHRLLAGAPRQVLQHAQTSAVRPVYVLHHQQQRLLLAQDIRESDEILEQAYLICFWSQPGILFHSRVIYAHFWGQLKQVRQYLSRQFHSIILVRPQRTPCDLGEGRIWGSPIRLAFPYHNLPSGDLGLCDDLAHQACLADPRFAADQQQLSFPVDRVLPHLA